MCAILLGISHPAAASPGGMSFGCDGCVLDPNGIYWDDYTVPTDGLTYQWNFWLFSSDPNATVFLDYPNEVYAVEKHSGDTFYHFSNTPFSATFDEVVTPHFTSITVSGPADYDNCTASTPLGELCSVQYAIWGNGTVLRVNATTDVVLFTSDPHVPEPATWAMMILGCGVVGAVLRRQRHLTKGYQ